MEGGSASAPRVACDTDADVGVGALGGCHFGLLNAWCDDDQQVLMRCQGFSGVDFEVILRERGKEGGERIAGGRGGVKRGG